MARKWNPAHHPRDKNGRFTRSASRVMSAGDRKRGQAALKGFQPAPIRDAAAGRTYLQEKAPKAPEPLTGYLGGDSHDVNAALRAGKTAPGVDEIDKAMTPLPDDLVLRRQIPMALFAHVPMKDLEGMKVRDAAYQSTVLDLPGDGTRADRDGMVTMHIAAPAGTPAAINAADGEILLARDTEVAIARAEPDGRGGWDVYGTVIPRTDAPTGNGGRSGNGGDSGHATADTTAGEPAGTGQADTSVPGDGGAVAGEDDDKQGAAAAADRPDPSGNTGQAGSDATSAPAGTSAQDSDGLTTDPSHVLSHSVKAAAGGQGVRSFVQPDGTVRLVAQSVQSGRDAYERGVTYMRRNFPGIDVPGQYEVRVRKTSDRHPDKATGGYRDERTGDVVVPLTSDDFVARSSADAEPRADSDATNAPGADQAASAGTRDGEVPDLSAGKAPGSTIDRETAYRTMHGDKAADAKFGKRDTPADKPADKPADTSTTSGPAADTTPDTTSASDANNGPTSPEAVDHRVQQAIAAILNRDGGNPTDVVSLARVRDELAGMDRADVDAALRRLDRARVIQLDPDTNRKALSDRAKAAAIPVGGEDMHLVSVIKPLDNSGDNADAPASDATQPAPPSVPDDVTALSDDGVADLLVQITSTDGDVDQRAVDRLIADLDRRDADRILEAETAEKRALVDKAPADYADDAELERALKAAADLGDEHATDRILTEWSRREAERDGATADPTDDRAVWSEEQTEEERRISELVADGWDWLEAYAEVHNLDSDQLRRDEATSAALGGDLSDKSIRQHYQEHVYRQWLDAEAATNGHLLTAKAEAKGIDPRSVFSGRTKDALRYASEELKRWWADHPRLTYPAFKAQLSGAAKTAQELTAVGSSGNEFA